MQFNNLLADKENTQQSGGGNTEEFYASEGTYLKSDMLVREFPNITRHADMFGRAHHYVNHKDFTHEPKLIADQPARRDYPMELVPLSEIEAKTAKARKPAKKAKSHFRSEMTPAKRVKAKKASQKADSHFRSETTPAHALMFSGWAMTGFGGQALIRHTPMIDETADILTFNTSNQINNALQPYLPVANRINFPHPSFFASDVKSMSDWEEVYASLNVEPLAYYKSLYIIGGAFSPGGQIKRAGKRVGVFPKDRGQLKFESTSKLLIHLLAMLKVNREYGTPIHELSFDPLEMSLSLVHQDYQPTENYHLYHGYDVSSYAMKRLDSLQFYFQKNAASHQPHSTKSTDFVFGFTAMKNSGRRSYVYEIDEIANRSHLTKSSCEMKFPTIQRTPLYPSLNIWSR